MQQTQKTTYEKCFNGVTGIAWVAGLLIAGSDSSYMPWLNGIGLLLFFGASFLLVKLVKHSHSNAGIVIYPKFYQQSGAKAMKAKKENQKIYIRYAADI